MIVSQQLIADASALINVLQSAQSVPSVLSALGVKEMALMSPFNVRITGGFAELNNVRVRKPASSSNEVITYDQAQAMIDNAMMTSLQFGIPDLGPKALVSFDGTDVVAPVNPTTGTEVYRLQVDLVEPSKLKWVQRPYLNSPGLPTSIQEPYDVAIGTFTTPPTGMDLMFADTESFFQWLVTHVVYEPLTLHLATSETHALRYPVADAAYPTPTPGYEAAAAARPLNLRPHFAGNGRLHINARNADGVSTSVPLVLSHLWMDGVRLSIDHPLELSRTLSGPYWHHLLHLRNSDVVVNEPVIVHQTGAPVLGSTRDDVLYSVVLHRCSLSGTSNSFIAISSEGDAPHWGRLYGCNVRNGFALGAWINEAFAGPDVEADYRAAYSKIGWRVVNTEWRSTEGFHRSLDSAIPVISYLSAPSTYTFVNCKMWFTELILGAVLGTNASPVNVNFVQCFVRAKNLLVLDMERAPTIVKISGSSVLANSMSLQYLTDQTPFGPNKVNRSLLELEAYIHLEASEFGVVDRIDEGVWVQPITGDSDVKPTIYAAARSTVYLPLAYSQALNASDPLLVGMDSTSMMVIT